MVAAMPNTTESMVISASADMAPAKTIKRGWRIAMMAAMKKVLSPNSVNNITDIDAENASIKPELVFGSLVASSLFKSFAAFTFMASFTYCLSSGKAFLVKKKKKKK